MFQTYEPVSDKSFAGKHLPKLRRALKAQNLDGFIIPHDDEYQNEYIPAYSERLMWASGFSGSAGAAIVMQNRAVIFVDGRYTLQARAQVDEAHFSYEDISARPPRDWLAAQASRGDRIGYDPMLHTVAGVKALKASAEKSGFELIAVEKNPVDVAWTDQPSPPMTPAYPHALSLSGQSAEDKRAKIAQTLKSTKADAALITAPPSVAWAFNIRGSDVARTPLPLSRAILYADGSADLFIAPQKADDALRAHLGENVRLHGEDALTEVLAKLGGAKKTISLDPMLTPVFYETLLREKGANIIEASDPCALPRACKNEVELEGARTAHIRDGAAVTRFLHWLATKAQSGEADEITAAKKLEEFRHETNALVDISFDSISGAGANGAIVHYRVTTETNATLEPSSLYLIDSGGQYKDGTTDITRTVAIGGPSDEMKDRFTRVLKGHIALAQMRFPEGTTGAQLDAVARKPLWDVGLDYDHGTGHGVGSFLGVHEGPQGISKAARGAALKPGMILSNEPGYYKTGAYGIRIENLIIVSPPETHDGAERAMMGFETITLAPISLDLIKPAILSESERHWLNKYHARVRQTLNPLLPEDVKLWLAHETRSI